VIIRIILLLILAAILLTVPVLADDTSMTIQDIKDAKPSIPFGVDFFTMIIAGSKWFAFFGFLIGITLVLAQGPVAAAMNNANMSANAQNGLFNIAKIVILGAVVYLLGMYLFETYL